MLLKTFLPLSMYVYVKIEKKYQDFERLGDLLDIF